MIRRANSVNDHDRVRNIEAKRALPPGRVESSNFRFPVQVGTRDFALDLLFFHRGLNCLVVFELKVQRFEPEHLGKMTFYLEALDRDVRKAHEQPSIGVLLCASKEDKVVEYALSCTLSPALIAEYQTALPDKKLLQVKLQEFYMQDTREGEAESVFHAMSGTRTVAWVGWAKCLNTSTSTGANDCAPSARSVFVIQTSDSRRHRSMAL